MAVRLATRLFGQQDDKEQVLECRRIGITNGLEVQLNFRRSNIYCSDIFNQKLVYDSMACSSLQSQPGFAFDSSVLGRDNDSKSGYNFVTSGHSARVFSQTTRHVGAHHGEINSSNFRGSESTESHHRSTLEINGMTRNYQGGKGHRRPQWFKS